MSLFRNVVFVSALAGLVAGIAMTGLQYAGTVPLILKAEIYEGAGEGHDNAGAASDAGTATASVAHDHGHEHAAVAPSQDEDKGWAPANGFERSAFTALANIVTAIGFALLLVSASELKGGLTGWRQGIFWGLAGFAVFTLAPGLGLPPELPGMPAAALDARQIWWFSTAAATAAGLALMVFRRSLPLTILAVLLIVAPHVIGAPKPDSFRTAVPEGLAQDFVVAVAMTSFIFWVLLGGTAGYIRSRFMRGLK